MKKKVWDHALGKLFPGANKILLKMKLTLCIVLISFLGSMATDLYSQTTKLSLDLKNTSVKEVLGNIETQSEFFFLYSEKIIDVNREVNIEVKGSSIEKILDKLFAGTNVNYTVKGRQIVLTTPEVNLFETYTQQQKSVSGKVTDSSGGSLPGVSVVVKGTTTGTITDANGNYSLSNISANATLQFSFVGMKTQEAKIGGQNIINVTLNDESVGIEEVVAVGYGIQKKEAITGSIASIKSTELVRTPAASTTNTLGGLLPGLISRQTQGVPGGDQANLSIRGFGNALIIVDGVESSFNNIDASQIETVSILKDASASIYGARAGNGVILVTTKRGINQKPTITLNSSFTLQGSTIFPRPASSGQIAEMAREAHLQSGKPASTAPFSVEQIEKYFAGNDPDYINTDWFDALIRTWTPMQQYDLSLRGGTEKLKYYGYAGYVDQPTFFKNNGGGYKRYNIQSNVDAEITTSLSLRVDLASTIENRDMPNMVFGTGYDSGWLQVWGMDPMGPAYLPDRTKVPFNHQSAHVLTNREIGGYNDQTMQRIKGTVTLDYKLDKLLKGLSAKYFFNYMKGDWLNKQFYKPGDYYTYNRETDTYTVVGHFSDKGSLSMSDNKELTLTNQFSLNYDNTFLNDHHLKVLALFESIDYSNNFFGASRKDFITPLIQQLYAGSKEGQGVWGSGSEMGRESVVGRLNYTFKDKYLFESSFRADASAKFPSNSRWGFFPSVSFGWIASQEDFLSKFENVDLIKARMSYGESGYDNVGNFDYLAGYTLGDTYLFGNKPYQSIQSKGLANPNLTWEKINISNVGVDFSFFKRKLYGEADAFYRFRSGIPANRLLTLDPSFGAQLPPENINSISDRGFELKMGTSGNIGKFNYDVSGNISWSRARWEHFEEPEYTDPDQIRINKQTGNWVDRTFGFRSDKLFTSKAEIDKLGYDMDQKGNVSLKPGDVKILDVNGDKIVDWRDRVELGAGTTPHWMTGVNVKLNYSNFDFSALFQGAFGYTSWVHIPNSMYPYTPAALLYELRWTEEENNPNSLVARLGGASDGSGSDFKIKDAGYLRLKNFSFGYNLPQRILESLSIKQARVYLSGTNLITLSKLNKYQMDPEAPSGQGGYYYPQQKTISFGLNLSF